MVEPIVDPFLNTITVTKKNSGCSNSDTHQIYQSAPSRKVPVTLTLSIPSQQVNSTPGRIWYYYVTTGVLQYRNNGTGVQRSRIALVVVCIDAFWPRNCRLFVQMSTLFITGTEQDQTNRMVWCLLLDLIHKAEFGMHIKITGTTRYHTVMDMAFWSTWEKIEFEWTRVHAFARFTPPPSATIMPNGDTILLRTINNMEVI